MTLQVVKEGDGEVADPAQVLAELTGGTTLPGSKTLAVETSPTLEEVAAKAEEELLATEAGEETVEAGEKKEVVGKTVPPIDPIQSLIDTKYGGDRQKFVDGLHEQWKSAASLHSEIQELKTLLAKEPETDPADYPELSRIDAQLTSLDSEIQDQRTEQAELVQEANGYQAKVHRLEGKLEATEDPLDKKTIEREIQDLKRDIRSLSKDWKAAKAKEKKLDSQKLSIADQREQAEVQISQSRQQKVQQELENKQYQEQELGKFNKAVEEEAKGFGIEGEMKEYLRSLVKSEASYYIRNLPPNVTDGINLPEFVASRMKVHAAMFKLGGKKEFSQQSKEKIQASAKVPAAIPPAPTTNPQAPSATPKRWTADFARARAAKVLG